MRSTPGLILLSVLAIISVLVSTAAIARSSQEPSFFSFSSHFFNPPHPPTTTKRPSKSQYQPPQEKPPPPATPEPTQTTPGSSPTPSPTPQEYKYFHEPGYTYDLSHYDTRFFRGAVPYADHRAALQHLIRSYLNTTSALGLETWLAHGTLLGWWWNGRIMPWDYDIDVQVSGATLGRTARELNGTVYTYRYEEEEGEGKRKGQRQKEKQYFLDINPHWSRLDRGQGMNVIDARWIDVETGMYVDITVLLERDPEGAPGVVSCKNYHAYRAGELYPLRETEFEGIKALVPYEFETVLMEEYGAKSLVTTEWAGHKWDEEKGEWVKLEEPEREEEEQALET